MKKLFSHENRQQTAAYLASALALFWVLFQWNFWDYGVYSMGFNTTIFLAGVLYFLHFIAPEKLFSRKNIFWLTPIIFIVASFSLYENPWLKRINLFIFPLVIGFIYQYLILKKHQKKHWNFIFLGYMFGRIFSFFTKIFVAFGQFSKSFLHPGKSTSKNLRSVLIGVSIFLILAFLIVIPLLSSADPVFKEKISEVLDFFYDLFISGIFQKIMFFLILTIFFIAVALAWGEKFAFDEKEEEEFRMDNIISGIVLGGILALYFLFLWVQMESFWINDLPSEFSETESLVKTGFWQLFFLSFLNVICFFVFYRKTNRFVQWLLFFFGLSSLLLLVSAGHKMYLYVFYHGLSYEKFFASYTVLYCIALFFGLLLLGFGQKRLDIFKFLVGLFVWMYGVANILPLEQIIIRTNVALKSQPNSKIEFIELRMLSSDVLAYVREKYNADAAWKNETWEKWIAEQEDSLQAKQWYEMNVSHIVNAAELSEN